MNKILVCYHTKTGSTSEASGIISATLKKNGYTVDLLPLAEVTGIEQYDAVVIGAPINGMQWVPQAVQFTETWESALREKKTAVFCLSYIYFTGGSFWQKAIAKTLETAGSRIKAIKTGIFGGRIDSFLPAPMRFIFKIKKDAPLSIFDPKAIEKWTLSLIQSLKVQ